MVVYTTADGGFREVAADVANRRGERVVDDLPTEPGERVVYVDAPDAIDAATLLELQRRLDAHGPDRGGFSVVTGYEPETARRLYEARASGDEHALLAQRPHGAFEDTSFEDDEATVLIGDDVTVDNLDALQADGLRSLALQTHGWPIHLNLSDGFVCGYPDSRDPAAYDGPQPHCVQDGEKTCPFDEDLLSAEGLDADHVFLVSCASVIDNGMSGLPVHVGLGLLDGATSLLGSYRPGATQPHELLLYYALLRAGYDVVERAYLLARHSHVNDIMQYPYVPFGRPEARFDGAPASPEPTVTETPDGVAVTVDPGGAHLVDVRVPADAFDGDPERAYVRSRSDAPDGTLYYAAFRDGESMRLLLYTGTRLSADELSVVLAETPPAHDTRRKYANALHAAERNLDLGIIEGKARRQTASLRDQVKNLPVSVSRERFDADAHDEVREQVAELEGNVSAIRDQLVSIATEGEYFQNEYRSRAIDDDVFPADADCFNCGRPVIIKQISDGDRTYRSMGVCPQCGHVFDVPTTPGDRSPPHPVISGERSPTGERFRDLVVTFENPLSCPMDATFAPSLRHEENATADGEPFFDPVTATRELAPGEAASVTFTLDTDLVDDNQHYLLARVVGNNAVYSGNAPVVVGEHTGFIQPWYRE
jgi:hypothetical protein